MTITLNAEARDLKTKNEKLRANGKIPAVYYGTKQEATPITLDQGEFIRVYHEAGESTLISLQTPSGEEQALVQDYQQDPVTDKVIHVDFKIIESGKEIEVTIPLEFTGEAPIVERGEATTTKVLHEVDVKCLPKNLPQDIKVDISGLESMDDQILVQDLTLPEGVEVLQEPEDSVVVVSALKEEEPEETEEDSEIDFSEIEVESKGKEEEEGEESQE